MTFSGNISFLFRSLGLTSQSHSMREFIPRENFWIKHFPTIQKLVGQHLEFTKYHKNMLGGIPRNRNCVWDASLGRYPKYKAQTHVWTGGTQWGSWGYHSVAWVISNNSCKRVFSLKRLFFVILIVWPICTLGLKSKY